VTSRRIHVQPPLDERFAAIRDELEIVEPFPADALAEAEAAARAPRLPDVDATEIEFFTIDPPGSRDLDQAMQLERRGKGYRVRYAIADLAAFVTPGGALDAAVWARGVTYYAPDKAVPLHPPVLAAGAASLLEGEVRPAIVWTLDLDADGALEDTHVARARVRSRARLDYAGVQERIDREDPFRLLAEIGALRQQRERDRGGVNLPLPEQEVVPAAGGGWSLEFRAPLPVEGFNAQISLLTGMAAAQLMLAHRAGILRTVPDADPKALARLERSAGAFGIPWVEPYPEFIRSLDPATPVGAALLHDATAVMRGAGYAAFDGDPPAERRHAALAMEYAHVTAPLRRLADRYALECCLEEPAPGWVRERLAELPEAMKAADRRAGALERAAVDLVEAALLEHRVGEEFPATVIDDGLVQLLDPAVRAKCDGKPKVGTDVRARLVEANPDTRTVRFVVP
jgi:exoribonuclease R